MDAQSAAKFVATNSIFAVGEKPERRHPLIESERRIFKDGSDFEAELFFAVVAEPDAASLNERVLCFAATRTGNIAVRKAQFQRVVETALRIAEVCNGLLKCLGLIHAQILH